MGSAVLYIVKSWVPKEYADEFNTWYDHTHLPQVAKASGCEKARRFCAIQNDDKFMYMVVYEFADMDAFLKYENSEAKQELVADFRRTFGGRAETKKYVWEEVRS